MDAIDINRNNARLRKVKMWRIVRLLSVCLTLCFILALMVLTLQTVPTGKQTASAMDFPNLIMKGSVAHAQKFGRGIKNLLPILREDSTITEVKDTVIKPDSTLLPKPKKVFGTKKAQAS